MNNRNGLLVLLCLIWLYPLSVSSEPLSRSDSLFIIQHKTRDSSTQNDTAGQNATFLTRYMEFDRILDRNPVNASQYTLSLLAEAARFGPGVESLLHSASARTAVRLGRYDRGLFHARTALELAREAPVPRFIAHFAQSEAYLAMEEIEPARQNILHTLELLENLHDPWWQFQALILDARVQILLEDLSLATERLGRADTLLVEYPHLPPYALHETRGYLYRQEDSHERAINEFREGLYKAEMDDVDYYRARFYLDLGTSFQQIREYSSAEPMIRRSMKISARLELPTLSRDAHGQLAHLYEGRGTYRSALRHLKMFHAIKDSLFSAETKRRIMEVENRTAVLQQSLEDQRELLKSERQLRLSQARIDQLAREKQQNKTRQRLLLFLTMAGLLIGLVLLLLYREKRTANQRLLEKNSQIEDQRKILENVNDQLQLSNEVLHIKNQQVLEKQTELSRANAAKDRFFSIIAHDLKNPFQSLLGMSDLLLRSLEGFDPQKVRRMVGNIYSASNQAYKLLQNLLEWSRVQIGSLDCDRTDFLLTDVVEEVIGIVTSSAQRKEITVKSMVDPHIGIHADINMTRTVLRNLVTNAVKFTHPGGHITISSDRQGDAVRFVVADNGVGIPPENIDKLFRIDAGISSPGTSNERGTGLGLILCREFIEKNDGSIQVESKTGGEDHGSRFIVTLPVSTKQLESHPGHLHVSKQDVPDFVDFQVETDPSLLPHLLKVMQNQLYPHWKNVSEAMIIGNIEDFAQLTLGKAKAYRCPSLIEWATDLRHLARTFDMERLPETLARFPGYLEKLQAAYATSTTQDGDESGTDNET